MKSRATHPAPTPRALLGTALVAGLSLLGPLPAAQAQTRPTLASLQAAVDCLSLPTITVSIPLKERGTYNAAGSKLVTGIAVVGRVTFQATVYGPHRNYFVFDLYNPAIADHLRDMDVVVGAELLGVIPPTNGFASDASDTLTLVVNRVSTSAHALLDGTAGTAGYLDLGDGPVYGSYVASAATVGQITVPLSDKAVRDINRARHAGFGGVHEPYLFAIGGTVANLGAGTDNAFISLGDGNLPMTNTALVLNVRRHTPACPPPLTSQYQ